jgi:hypothetical protein
MSQHAAGFWNSRDKPREPFSGGKTHEHPAATRRHNKRHQVAATTGFRSMKKGRDTSFHQHDC